MECQSLFSGQNKETIIDTCMWSAKFGQSVVKAIQVSLACIGDALRAVIN